MNTSRYTNNVKIMLIFTSVRLVLLVFKNGKAFNLYRSLKMAAIFIR